MSLRDVANAHAARAMAPAANSAETSGRELKKDDPRETPLAVWVDVSGAAITPKGDAV
jgi:hypothetical protein